MRRVETDVLVIGSGFTGSVVARKYVDQNRNVVMLERGNSYAPRRIQALDPNARSTWWLEQTKVVGRNTSLKFGPLNHVVNTFENKQSFSDLAEVFTGLEPYGFNYNMFRAIGGSGNVWSGFAWRFPPDDFSVRSKLGYGRDWALSYADLAPFYDEAERLLGVSGPEGAHEPWWPWLTSYVYPEFERSYLATKVQKILGPLFEFVGQPHAAINDPSNPKSCEGYKTCANYCPTGALFRPFERLIEPILFNDGFFIEEGVAAVDIVLSECDKSINHVVGFDGSEYSSYYAKEVFLCGNTVENIRLLQYIKQKNSSFLASTGNSIGSGMTSHYGVSVKVRTKEKLFPVRGRPTHISSIQGLKSDIRREKSIGGIVVEVWDSDYTLGGTPQSHLINLSMKGHWGETLAKQVSNFEGQFMLNFVFETESHPQKQVYLSEDIDKFGIPIACITMPFTERDHRTLAVVFDYVEKISHLPDIESVEITGMGYNGNHPLGGVNMGDSPNNSVTDSFGRCHDVPNLHILGGGGFSSVSALNPTLTIVALTLRSLSALCEASG